MNKSKALCVKITTTSNIIIIIIIYLSTYLSIYLYLSMSVCLFLLINKQTNKLTCWITGSIIHSSVLVPFFFALRCAPEDWAPRGKKWVQYKKGLMHDNVLLISFTTKPRIQNANVSQKTGTEKNTSMKCGKSVRKLHGSEAWW